MFCTNCMAVVSDPIDFDFMGGHLADVLEDIPFRVEGPDLHHLTVSVPEAYHWYFTNYHMDMAAWCEDARVLLTEMDYEEVECPVCSEPGTLFDDEASARQYHFDNGVEWPV